MVLAFSFTIDRTCEQVSFAPSQSVGYNTACMLWTMELESTYVLEDVESPP